MVLDTTLRDGEQSPGCSMKLEEKIQLAKQLEQLKVDYIEAGFPVASPDDFEAVKAISRTVKDAGVVAMCRATTGDISCAWEAVRQARQPRLHVVLSVSDIHLEHKLRMSREEVLERAAASVRFARGHCSDIQFSPEDCSRADRGFLMQVVNAAVEAGASLINLTDTVGYLMPEETAELVRYVRENLRDRSIPVGIHCHDDLGMAVANTVSAVRAGASHVECTIGGIGERAGNAALEEVVMALRTRGEYFGCTTGVNPKELFHANKLLSNILETEIPANKAIVGDNAFAHEAGIHQHGVLSNPLTYEIMHPEDVGRKSGLVLGKHSGRAALSQRLDEMGYRLDGKTLRKVSEAFKVLCDRKKAVTDRDIEELVRGQISQKQTYTLQSFVVNSGTNIPATAVVKLLKDGREYEQVEKGESPVIAGFNAVDRIIRHSYPLHHFTIQSVSEGRTALSEIVVQIEDGERLVAGRGMDTDIVAASIKAYLSAINKILAYRPRKQQDAG